MDAIAQTQSNDGMLKNAALVQGVSADGNGGSSASEAQAVGSASEEPRQRGWKGFGRRKNKQSYSHAHFKVYKRRWFGLAQLVLLNIVVSWDVGSRPSLSITTGQLFSTLDSRVHQDLQLAWCGLQAGN